MLGEPPLPHELLETPVRQGAPESLGPQRLDYLNEGLALERQGDFEAALTSYRLAFRDNPTDSRILLNMAIAFTKTGQPEEAIRHYKRALELDDSLGGAHYGVAFLLLKRGDAQQAAEHLRAFLARPPRGPTRSGGCATRRPRCATSRAARPRRRCEAPIGSRWSLGR